MKKYTWIWIDVLIDVIFLVLVLMTYALDEYLIARVIFGVMSIFMLVPAIVTYILAIKKDRIPIALPSLSIILLFTSGFAGCFYVQAYGTSHYPYNMGIFIVIIIGVALLSLITVLVSHWKAPLKKCIISFLVNTVIYCFISFLVVLFFVNYAFDLSQPTDEIFIVKEAVGVSTRGGGYFGSTPYSVEYIGDNDDVLIYEIELKTEYIYETGDRVKVKFRKGLFDNLYKVDYTNATFDGELIPIP